jgi:glutaminase
VIDADGNVAAGGDADTPFSIQSISKVFTLTLALGKVGDNLWQRVGREPSGSPFNSIVQLEFERGKPRNPFINAGAIAMSCRQLAMAGRYLALSGRHPTTGLSVVSPERARRINAVMLTCGHYDGSGEFAFRVGLPGKSGVGGGILAIAPGRASIAVWSPGLDAVGNSHLGLAALEMLSRRLGLSIFGA